MRILVLGLGNTLLSDEGVGIHVVHALEPELGDDREISLMDGGTLSFTLAVPIESCDALAVVDAAQLQADPGTVRVFRDEAMDAFLSGNRKSSVHEVGLIDLMAIAKLSGRWPERRALVAIQPEIVDWGTAPGDRVGAAIPQACADILELIGDWRGRTG